MYNLGHCRDFQILIESYIFFVCSKSQRKFVTRSDLCNCILIFSGTSSLSLSIIPAVLVCCLLVAAFIIVWRRPRSCPWTKYGHRTITFRRRPLSSSSQPHDSPPHSPYMQLHNNHQQEESSFSYDRLPSVQSTAQASSYTRTMDTQQRLDQEVSVRDVDWRIGESTSIGGSTSHESSIQDV